MKRAVVPVSIATTAALLFGGAVYAFGAPTWLAIALSVLVAFVMGAAARGAS